MSKLSYLNAYLKSEFEQYFILLKKSENARTEKNVARALSLTKSMQDLCNEYVNEQFRASKFSVNENLLAIISSTHEDIQAHAFCIDDILTEIFNNNNDKHIISCTTQEHLRYIFDLFTDCFTEE